MKYVMTVVGLLWVSFASSADFKDTIRQKIKKNHKKFETCYIKGIKKHPGAAGTLVLSFKISPAGEISDVQKKNSDLFSDDIENCVIQTVKKMKFPKRHDKSDLLIEYPFKFSRN